MLNFEVAKVPLAVIAARLDGGGGLDGQGVAEGRLDDGQDGEHPGQVANEAMHSEKCHRRMTAIIVK